ncbi:hypothetical protein FBQ81_02100 [Chloroflexi bacterium CFX6]|nr:hypothetical protein [Chloroflexi bacterium CFX6]
MPDIICSNCGNPNPDFLDACQFCQSPLKSESMLHIGEEPTKKDTGELEQILPDWLKDAREQGKAEAADDALQSPITSRVQKEEPPDLLAGLMSQADSDEEEVPDWLKEIQPEEEKGETPKPSSEAGGKPSNFFSQFEEQETGEPMREEPPSESKDELTDWFSQASAEPAAPFSVEETGDASGGEEWMKDLESFNAQETEPPAEKEPEDLSWLHELEAASKKIEETPEPQGEAGSDFASSSEENPDWLKNLGAASAPAFEESAPSQPASSEEDLSWLDQLGGATEPAAGEPAPGQPLFSEDDLKWLSDLGGTEPSETTSPAFTEEGAQDSETTISASKPFRTAPLNEMLNDEAMRDAAPDWLLNALEEPSMPPPGAASRDWFAEQSRAQGEQPSEEPGAPTQEEPAPAQPAFESPPADASSSSAQDLDALFDMEMPDWLSREPESAEAPPAESLPAAAPAEESLAPVELPSWVQAMRPVDSAIEGEIAGSADRVTEREGPLAGFSGVIPLAPIGSSLRPKTLSLKLQVTDEQQAGATLLEQIIAGETLARERKAAPVVSPQRMLRWALSAIFLVVLSVVIGLGLRIMPISPSAELSNLVSTIPDASPALVVVDYEPSFAGELEAAAGPLLDQLALARHSTFTFVSMSPNGSALVDRLMVNTKVGVPVAGGGLGYQSNEQYFNLGFLPGGSAGVLGFIENPANGFSQFAAVVLMTDNAETARVWVEQLEAAGSEIAAKPLIVVSSAQSGPMLEPYVASGQVDIMVNGLYDAAKYELVNVSRPGIARAYWDAFGIGLMMAILAIVFGSVWSLLMRFRERRAEAEQG